MARRQASATMTIDETYDLRGLNLVAPDQVMPEGETPRLFNSRMYAKDEDQSRVTVRTRKGSTVLSAPVGQTLNVQNVDTVTTDIEITTTRAILLPITPTADGPLTRLDFEVKRGATGRGPLTIRLFEDNSGLPGTEITDTSISGSDITDTYQFLPSYLMDAPDAETGVIMWALLQIQDNGAGSYYISGTATAGAYSTEDNGVTLTPLGVMGRFKSYISIDYPIKGWTRRYPSTGDNSTIFAAGGAVYAVEDNGTVSEIGTCDINSTDVKFDTVDDKTIWVDGISAPQWWDGTTDSTIANAPIGASDVIIWQNRAFFLTTKVRVDFSDLYSFESYPSVNFFYVPSPKSSDHVAGWKVFQDALHISTHKTKHIIYGSDISTFTRKEAVGTNGSVNSGAMATDRGLLYFIGPDGQLYAYNGVDDKLLSGKMEPEFSAVPNKKQMRIHIYRGQIRVYYTLNSASGNDRMALYDIEYKQWFRDTGRAVAGSLAWDQDDNELIEFSSRVGQVFYGDRGGSDAGKAIDFEYCTNYKIYGSGSARKRIKRFRPYIRPTDNDFTMLVGRDFDFEDDPEYNEYVVSSGGARWGEFVWGDGTVFGGDKYIDTRAPMSGRGKHVQYRFKRKGVDNTLELVGYFALVKVGRAR